MAWNRWLRSIRLPGSITRSIGPTSSAAWSSLAACAKLIRRPTRPRARVTKAIVIQAAMPPAVKVVIHSQPGSSTVEVQATATPAGEDPVTSMQLLIDGRPEGSPQPVGTGSAPQPVAQQHSWKVDLPPGEHSLSVRADTDKSYGLGQASATIGSAGKSCAG